MRVLAIGAHFDDVELGCGGALLKHRDAGDEIFILVITHSGYESPTKNLLRTKEQARLEGEKSAKKIGATLICCDKEPLILTPTEKVVLEIESIINQVKPDRVYTHQPYDNHADHAAVGYMSTRACRKCDEVFLYRSNWYITDNTQSDDYYVNISSHMEEKLELIKLFESEMKNVNYSWNSFIEKQNEAAGAKVGVAYAETFRVMKIFWR